jgi:hypothetical protein
MDEGKPEGSENETSTSVEVDSVLEKAQVNIDNMRLTNVKAQEVLSSPATSSPPTSP